MVDITSQFRASLLEARNRHGVTLDKNRILKKGKPHVFSVRAADILSDIKRVECFLKEEQPGFGLSQAEIDEVENGALSILRTTKLLIGKYRKDLESAPKMQSQVSSHFTGVADVLEKKLKAVEEVFMRQRNTRILDLKIKREMSLLEDSLTPLPTIQTDPPQVVMEDEQASEIEELSPEEMQMFESENSVMYEELQRTRNEVQSIENKVVQIAELQELFSEKILQQKDDIELVSRNALAASENIKDGNEELRKAIQNKASIRVYILFSLLVLSFSLLFLDWYNP